MSDIRFNRWLHQSGTGGISQDSTGNIGIGTTVPTMALDIRGDVNIGDTININNASGIISATTFTGTTGTFSGNVSAVDATFTGNVAIGGTLTYEDVSNIDAVGIITAQSDIIVGGGLTVTGISTFNNDVKLLDSDKLKFGIGEDLQIYHDPGTGDSFISETGAGNLKLTTSSFRLRNAADTEHIIWANQDAEVRLYHDNSKKFETTSSGAIVTGILTATTFSGNLTGNVTGDLTGNLAGISSIAAISSTISDTAVDVFIYDTSKDSDGGDWRKRTQNTSWYNETLNTATRGSRKEFPAVAVIVAETTKVTIYDGDDPDLPMWMVINRTANCLFNTSSNATALAALNGTVCFSTDGGGNYQIRFIEDFGFRSNVTSATSTNFAGNISERHTALGHVNIGRNAIVSQFCNDVAMTVLPNAPIDSATGLPVPTIAVATAGGLSVIKDDGTVVDWIETSGPDSTHKVSFRNNGKLGVFTSGTSGIAGYPQLYYIDIPSSDVSASFYYNFTSLNFERYGGTAWESNSAANLLMNNGSSGPASATLTDMVDTPNLTYAATGDGLNAIIRPEVFADMRTAAVAYIQKDYNTGYMVGDIKGAFLSDTDIEDGVELVSNGTFNTNTTGWTVNGGGSATISSGQVQITNNGTTNCSLDQTVTTVVGKTYEISATITPQGGGPLPRLYVGNKYVQVGSNSNSSQTVTLTFLAYSTSTIVSINANTNVNNAVTLADNVSMKLTNDVIGSEKIPNPGNGNFTATTDWVAQTAGGSLSISGANLRVNCSGNYHGCQVNTSNLPTLVEGKQYIMTVDVAAVSAGSIRFGVVSGMTYSGSIGGDGVHHTVFTAGASVTQIFIDTGTYGSSMYFELNSVNLREAELDRSINGGVGNNNKGLAVYGTVTKTAVATGAELVAYSGFSGNNLLVQPYNSNLNPGTGDYSFTFWFKCSATGSEQIYMRRFGVPTVTGGMMMRLVSSSSVLQWYVRDTSSSATTLNSTMALDDGIWHCAVGTRQGGNAKLYIDGKLNRDSTCSANSHDPGTTSSLVIGAEEISSSPGTYQNPADSSSMALIRYSLSVPSPEQIKKMYEDEKVLFQENAKATLYGSSDAVTALAFDDDTNLLHVGTSSGRSDFQGLRRINNNTTAVTTAITAQNEFIIEQ